MKSCTDLTPDGPISALSCRVMASTHDDHGRKLAYTGAEIKAARQRARLKQAAFAEAVGARPRTVGRWEAEGITVDSHVLGAVERVLHLGAYADPEPAPPASLTDKSDMELVADLHAIAAELTTRLARTDPDSDRPTLPKENLRFPRTVDQPNTACSADNA